MGERTLRIAQSTEGSGRYRVEVGLEGDGLPRTTATASFDFQLDPQHREDLRWYLEDYLQYPHDPAPTVAARIEGDIKNIGTDLFKKVFHSSDDARDLYATLRQKLDDSRVEVNTSVAEAMSIPWELIRDPKIDEPLALAAKEFVRSQPQTAKRPESPKTTAGPIRILLVICRPSGDLDVPFRSVATQLIKGLGDQTDGLFQLDVLRPATFERLGLVLRQAKADRRPYHVVHFDGHGMYAELPDESAAARWLERIIPVILAGPRTGDHGYLLFENPDHESNMALVDGPSLGKLLVETDVPLLVLNACRSAHAEAPTEPEQVAGVAGVERSEPPENEPGAIEPGGSLRSTPATRSSAAQPDDVHEQVRAFGSLAQEVMDAGVAGVVAMRYNVYVVTAAQFVADLYATLVEGRSLGESVSRGRKQLEANPNRTISFAPRPLQDWCVPIVYEAAPIKLFPKRRSGKTAPKLTIHSGETATERGSLDSRLPRPPDVGFFGRDETLLALDRAFDTQPIVLLHAYAGSGKTATAAEFARWYSLTGGVEGPVLFTSFETYTPLPRVLDRIGEVFGPTLEQSGVHWLTLDDDGRRDVALQVLKQVPVLWIWDNVEPIAGTVGRLSESSASGHDSESRATVSEGTYTPTERQALADFLRDAKQTRAKILLTSRRDERAWLGDLPCRISVPPMPMQERVQLARALAGRHVAEFVDPATEGPRPGQENHWSLVTFYRVLLAEESHDWDEAERLQRAAVHWDRGRAQGAIAAALRRTGFQPEESDAAGMGQSPNRTLEPRNDLLEADATDFVQRLQTVAVNLDEIQRYMVKTLAVSLNELGEIQRQRQQPECVAAYEESLALAEAINECALASTCAFNLGTTLKDLPMVFDLAQAKKWYLRGLALTAEADRVRRGQCQGQLGACAFARFHEGREAGLPKTELLKHINEALHGYRQALELLPDGDVNNLAVVHSQIGLIYGAVRQFGKAVEHFQQAIRFNEGAGNLFDAGRNRRDVSIALFQSKRLSDAREYARAALRDFQSYGDSAAEMIAKTERLLAEIEQAIGEH